VVEKSGKLFFPMRLSGQVSLLALIIIMNRIVVSPARVWVRRWASGRFEPAEPGLDVDASEKPGPPVGMIRGHC
jgi:hypothetical protein